MAKQSTGYTRYPHAILEYVYSAPLTREEKDIINFLVRRTFGWMKRALEDGEALVDQVSPREIAAGTGNSVRGIEKCLTRLVGNGILIRVPTEPHRIGSPPMYGVNPEVGDWGPERDPDWRAFRLDYQQALDQSLNTPRGVLSIRRTGYRQYAGEGIGGTPLSVLCGQLSACGTGARQAPKDSKDKDSTDKENDKGIAGDVAPAPIEQVEMVEAETPEKKREDSPAQVAANGCLRLYGLEHSDLTDDQKRQYYPAMNKLISELTGGADELKSWVREVWKSGVRELAHEARPERAIPAAVRREVTAKSWQDAFRRSREEKSVDPLRGVAPASAFGVPRDKDGRPIT